MIIKDFHKLSIDKQETIQDVIAGEPITLVFSDQMKALKKWVNGFKEKQGFPPDFVDLDKIVKLIETGDIDDQDLVVEPSQTTLEKFG